MSLTKGFLYAMLAQHNVDMFGWGEGNAKTVDDLLQEVLEGESVLQTGSDGLTRVVNIVKMHIFEMGRPERGNLVEVSQKLPDGRVRMLNKKPAGKIKIGEKAAQALVREVKEELGIGEDQYSHSLYLVDSEEVPSKSYPRLRCLYHIYHFNINIYPGSLVLQDEFVTTEEDGTELTFMWSTEVTT